MDRGQPAPGVQQIRTWQEAEVCAARWMRYWGFADAAVTTAGPDGGVDVTAAGALAQVKFQAVMVGSPELQRLFGARGHELHRQLLFFTGTGYSARAVEYAAAAGIALFTYDLAGQVDAVNEHARQLVADAEAARTPPPPRKPSATETKSKASTSGWRAAPQPETPAEPVATAAGMGCAATVLLVMGSLLVVGVTAGIYRPGFTATIVIVTVFGSLFYLAGLVVLLRAVYWGREHRHRTSVVVAILVATAGAGAMWLTLGRSFDDKGGGHAGAWTVTLMVVPLVFLAVQALSGRDGAGLSPTPPKQEAKHAAEPRLFKSRDDS